jgi:phage head maturation protease
MGHHAVNRTEVFHRVFAVDRTTVNASKRTVNLSFSSEAPVERAFGTEVLSHAPGACDLSRLEDRAALLVNHDPDRQCGVVESAFIDSKAKKGFATVRFSKGALGEEVFNDVKDSIREKVSVGYRINSIATENPNTPDEIQRVTSWTPVEISIVAIPADTTVGVGRAQRSAIYGRSASSVRTSAQLSERERAAAISRNRTALTVLRNDDIEALADAAIERGWSVDYFNQQALEAIADAPARNGDMLSDARDIKKYSLSRALLAAGEGKGDKMAPCFERDVSQQVAVTMGRSPEGFFVPHEVLNGNAHSRALSAATARHSWQPTGDEAPDARHSRTCPFWTTAAGFSGSFSPTGATLSQVATCVQNTPADLLTVSTCGNSPPANRWHLLAIFAHPRFVRGL